jgi:hypothetical protein
MGSPHGPESSSCRFENLLKPAQRFSSILSKIQALLLALLPFPYLGIPKFAGKNFKLSANTNQNDRKTLF